MPASEKKLAAFSRDLPTTDMRDRVDGKALGRSVLIAPADLSEVMICGSYYQNQPGPLRRAAALVF